MILCLSYSVNSTGKKHDKGAFICGLPDSLFKDLLVLLSLFVYIHVYCVMCLQCLQRPKEGARSPGTWSCGISMRVLGADPRSLSELPKLALKQSPLSASVSACLTSWLILYARPVLCCWASNKVQLNLSELAGLSFNCVLS